MADTPDTLSPEVAEMAKEWEPLTALLGGTRKMREAGQTYLPKHPAESQDSYDYRKSVSRLFNAYWHTISTLSAKPFREPLNLLDTNPSRIVELCKDVDLQGRNLQAFAHDCFSNALGYGQTHILADYPSTDRKRIKTVAQQNAAGIRPYLVQIKPTDLCGFRHERIAGVDVLTMLRFKECVREAAGNYADRDVEQVRILYRDHWEIYRKNSDKNSWFLYDAGKLTLGEIPLSTIYGWRTGLMTSRPPLLDLVYLNLEHWQSASDQSNILHVARVPILFASGFAEGTLKIGSNAAVTNDEPTADLKYVEHTGAAIGAGRDSLKDLEELMSLFGARMMIKVPGTKTATESAISTEQADSALRLMALNMEDALELSLTHMADWERIPTDGIDLKVCSDFGNPLESLSPEMLIRCREFGILSAETTFEELKRRGIVGDERTWDVEKAKLKAEGPPLGVAGSFEAYAGGSPLQTNTQPKKQ